MNVADIRTKSVDELKDELLKLRKEQLNLRFQRSTGQLENTAAMRNARKSVARVKTVLTQKIKGIDVASSKKDTKKTETKKTASKKPAAAKTADKKKKTA